MPVGFRGGICFDRKRSNWDASGDRPLVWSAWYPASATALAAVPTEASWFRRSPVARNAPLAPSQKPYPLVLLSHGSGASAAALEWLGHRLAQKGCVALAANHHGHTGGEPYRAEGFLCLWERAGDMSALLDDPSWRAALGGDIDQHAHVAGFSAGAYTAMLLVGARVAYSQFEPDNPVKSPIRGPREFPDLVDQLPKLHANPVFRTSWDRRRDDYADVRFRSATAIAPGRSALGFSPSSLQSMARPVHLFAGDADTVAPPAECCDWLKSNLPHATLEIITGGVGHYTFLPEGSALGLQSAPELFDDPPGLTRSTVHDYVATTIADISCRRP
jgi:predicted dienelactone hydrolase